MTLTLWLLSHAVWRLSSAEDTRHSSSFWWIFRVRILSVHTTRVRWAVPSAVPHQGSYRSLYYCRSSAHCSPMSVPHSPWNIWSLQWSMIQNLKTTEHLITSVKYDSKSENHRTFDHFSEVWFKIWKPQNIWSLQWSNTQNLKTTEHLITSVNTQNLKTTEHLITSVKLYSKSENHRTFDYDSKSENHTTFDRLSEVILKIWKPQNILSLQCCTIQNLTRICHSHRMQAFISMINKGKMQQKIQKDWNSKTLTLAPTFHTWRQMLGV